MYTPIIIIHNILRWVIVLAGLAAIVRAFIGWTQKKEWTLLDNRLSLIFTISMDIQFLLGLILYLFLSPVTEVAFEDFGAAMANSGLRFFAVEHLLIMVVALVLAHVARVLAKRAPDDTGKFRSIAIYFTVTMVLIFLGIPWDRPLFRLS